MKSGWIETCISDVAAVQSGSGFPVRYQGQVGRDIPFYKVSDMNISGNERQMFNENNSITEDERLDLGAFLFPKGSTIFPKIGGAIATNKKRLTTRACCVDNNVMGVVPKAGKIESEFLFYFFLKHDLSHFSNEAHLPSIKKTAVECWPIALPASLQEQRRIVAILDSAFEGIATAKANAEKNLRNTTDLAARQLTAILESESQKGSVDTLENSVMPDCSLSYGIVQPGEEVSSGLPIVRPVDLGPKVVGINGLKRIDLTLARSYARTTLKGGDLLLCVRGTTGIVAIAEPELAGANVTRGIVPIRFDPKFVTQALGYYLLRSDPVQAQIRAKTYGTALMQINIGDLRQIVLSFPPLGRQQQILEKLDAVQDSASRLADIYERKLIALEELKKSLLHQAFTGQL